MDAKNHWDNIYETKTDQEKSWFQSYPKTSIEIFESLDIPLTARIIDVGGGDSRFAEVLVKKGYENIWVLDISENAIQRSKNRLGNLAKRIHWIVFDITTYEFDGLQFDLWHDRAAFHFLTAEDKMLHYVLSSKDAIRKNGHMIVATFSEQGPRKCSGLDIKQYSEDSLSARFLPYFECINCIREDHVTPFQTTQNFLFCVLKRK